VGKEKPFTPVKPFCGIIYKRAVDCKEGIHILEHNIGAVDMESAEILFDSTTYYCEELGQPLFRKFISFSNLIPPEDLVDLKLMTNRIEGELTVDGKRRINIDPGYLSQNNIIIATTKNYYHRVPLQRGIYAHIEYIFRKNEPSLLPWTYPDFKKREYISFFKELKRRYKEDLKTI
jgi:hypothetical protein